MMSRMVVVMMIRLMKMVVMTSEDGTAYALSISMLSSLLCCCSCCGCFRRFFLPAGSNKSSGKSKPPKVPW